ncbi:hypothetical protein BGZ82_011403 [Podila clonocystis]|nr:hypothetical protein BGZ82_011403 [Podila clonocystis]
MEYVEQNYGSTLVFCVVATEFDKSDKALSRAQVKMRMFEAESPNLGSHGHWKCDLTETIQGSTRTVGLQLSLQWVRQGGTDSSQESLKSDGLISQIKSIKVRSDSTLSELLVDTVDGQSILKGESIQVKLEAKRVVRCGRYKFRVSLHTQDISRVRLLDKPIFTSFLDLDTSFDPVEFKEDTCPDVSFRFPVSRHCAESTVVCAHSSELKESGYLLNKMAKLSLEQAWIKKERDTDHIFECTVTEFSPMVFRVMLQYMYTGEMVLQPHSNYSQQSRDHIHAERCHFEDLYRIAERYEVQTLKELVLKAIRHTLNMSIAISLLTKISLDDLEGDDVGNAEKAYQQSVKAVAMDIVKEYIVFFGAEVFVLQADKRPEDLSIRERQHMIFHLGEYVLANLGRLWSA